MDDKDSTKKFIGHKNQETGEIQPLPAHLENVGRFAEAFAAAFGAGKAGRIAGTYHDIGKYAEPVRRRMETGQGRPYDHSTAGAKELYQAGLFPEAVCVAGHHSGLLDGGSRVSSKYDGTFLGRIKKEVPDDIPDYQPIGRIFPSLRPQHRWTYAKKYKGRHLTPCFTYACCFPVWSMRTFRYGRLYAGTPSC